MTDPADIDEPTALPAPIGMTREAVSLQLGLTVAEVTKAELDGLRVGMVEYTIAADEHGVAERYPHGHPAAGQVVVRHGPRDIAPASEIDAIERTKAVLLGLQRLWDFDVVVW